MDKLYTIIEVATKLGLSDKTLRRWEEAGRFTPSRTLGNQRRYTLEDLQILDAIKHGTINEQKDLLTMEQAGKLCGVSVATLGRWENAGKIHPFITSGNTYYPRTRLLEKLDELKKINLEPEPIIAPVGADYHPPEKYVEPARKLIPLSQNTRADDNPPLQIQPIFINIAITLVLLVLYHFLFNQTSTPVSPKSNLATSGTVQGTSTSTIDPRVDDLIAKFQTHLSDQMLKDAKPIPVTTINLDNTAFATGAMILPKNKDQILVPSAKITSTTPVTITFTSDYAPAKKYWVTPGDGSFTLHTDFPVGTDSQFNYSFLAIPATVSASASPSAIIKP